MIAQGDPNRLLDETDNPRVKEFLTRGETTSVKIAAGQVNGNFEME